MPLDLLPFWNKLLCKTIYVIFVIMHLLDSFLNVEWNATTFILAWIRSPMLNEMQHLSKQSVSFYIEVFLVNYRSRTCFWRRIP